MATADQGTIPRVLVLTLYSGENEFEQCKASVKVQTDVEAEQVVFSYLGNAAAHRALYSEIMDRANEYTFFVKLDADMVFKRPTALKELANFFFGNSDLDHLVTLVDDHFTGQPIVGLHAFSGRVKWNFDAADPLFVDPKPQYATPRVLDPEGLERLVDHAPNPSPYQAFHFGYHRALKAVQRGRVKVSPVHKTYNLSVLRDLAANYEKNPSRALGLALIAADMVFRGKLHGKSGDKSDASVEAAFSEVSSLDDAAIASFLRSNSIRLKFALWWRHLNARTKEQWQTRKTKLMKKLKKKKGKSRKSKQT